MRIEGSNSVGDGRGEGYENVNVGEWVVRFAKSNNNTDEEQHSRVTKVTRAEGKCDVLFSYSLSHIRCSGVSIPTARNRRPVGLHLFFTALRHAHRTRGGARDV